jgi:voltage-gated potassium channel
MMTPARGSTFRVSSLIGSPLRNLVAILGFMAVVMVVATAAYMAAGWSLGDAFYMVMLTVFTVGFREVRPIDSGYLRAVTMGVMFLGCTGMILMTGALVQLFTATEIRNLMGLNRMKNDIDKLKDHVVVCGFGRIGTMLGHELARAEAAFVIVDNDTKRVEAALAHGWLCLEADATDEAGLTAAGVQRARSVATVLPDDAANVFITLTARSLNKDLQIIARGEAPSTERKLIHAGADKVIMPTHIGAERIAELILHPATAELVRGSPENRTVERALRDFGLEIEVVSASLHNGVAGLTVSEVERRAAGAFFVAQVEHPGADPVRAPAPDLMIQAGDCLVVVGRSPVGFETVFGVG